MDFRWQPHNQFKMESRKDKPVATGIPKVEVRVLKVI